MRVAGENLQVRRRTRSSSPRGLPGCAKIRHFTLWAAATGVVVVAGEKGFSDRCAVKKRPARIGYRDEGREDTRVDGAH